MNKKQYLKGIYDSIAILTEEYNKVAREEGLLTMTANSLYGVYENHLTDE